MTFSYEYEVINKDGFPNLKHSLSTTFRKTSSTVIHVGWTSNTTGRGTMTLARRAFLFCILLSLGSSAPSVEDENTLAWASRTYRPTFEENISTPGTRSSWEHVQSHTTNKSQRDGIYIPQDINAMSSDARQWFLTGEANAEQGFAKFDAIMENLKRGKPVGGLLHDELESLLNQLSEANENTISMVPKFLNLVSHLYDWTRDPGWLDKILIKSAIWYVDGKRDNKSFYLLNGAELWVKLRKEKLATIETKKSQILSQDFAKLEDKIVTARDTLDTAAQIYVKGINKLTLLVKDIDSNMHIIQDTVANMWEELQKRQGLILETSQDTVDATKSSINYASNY